MKAVGLPIFAACLFVSQAAQSQYIEPLFKQSPSPTPGRPPTVTQEFIVCEGEYSNGCEQYTPTPCGTVDAWAREVCRSGRAEYLEKRLVHMSTAGSQCSYTLWRILCGYR
jgi:hypothetical protein